MSVLVPSQEPLTYRGCQELEYYHLLNWFAWVEILAWEMVNTYFGDNRPSKIFIVTGQTLTTGYAIAHKESCSAECQVLLAANVGLPQALDARALAQYNIQRAYASLGFEEVKDRTEGSNEKYSIFLDVYYSSPARAFKQSSLKSRLEQMYK